MLNSRIYFQDLHGSYSIATDDRIITAKMSGAIGDSLAQNFYNHLEQLIYQLSWPVWGYYVDLSDGEAETAGAQRIIAKLHQLFIENGCVVDTYTFGNPVALYQVLTTRQAVGITTTLSKQTFATQEEAFTFIYSILEKTELQLNQTKHG